MYSFENNVSRSIMFTAYDTIKSGKLGLSLGKTTLKELCAFSLAGMMTYLAHEPWAHLFSDVRDALAEKLYIQGPVLGITQEEWATQFHELTNSYRAASSEDFWSNSPVLLEDRLHRMLLDRNVLGSLVEGAALAARHARQHDMRPSWVVVVPGDGKSAHPAAIRPLP